ncbi:hypothetical protein [Arthrospiribacter ruber]|uniref:Uncharacterized protein n=1 Tax=Arthrospiribacter ruber TaxID=2487934 RepID=A0A951MGP9_9BACT|nr:hypothetical protein [Arthrospiribacter ruber]MBW3470442.1 hypothetical protein [Arthrospiribacter ruber]
MTIEALGSLKGITEITTDLLLKLYKENGLLSLNKRLKSYTMLFTKNGPLHNDKANGEKVYNSLFHTIIESFESEGDRICEISGLRFTTPFESIYEKALKNVGFTEKDIKKKDTTINRGWFPLIGGLGSDAQALPQAKFAIEIHPICVAILQFLPLSSLLFKGRILLIDSSNFEFTRSFIASNVKLVEKRIQMTSSSDSIDNIKDFAKGNYLLKAIKILEDKEIEDEYSDLNFWSFSNSGTGASCEIERVPNSLIKKLIRLKQTSKITNELINILSKDSHRFIEDLENNQDWYLLYPAVFGTGKNKGDYEGVSVAFMEAYYQEIQSPQKTEYAKYIAYLIQKYKSGSFTKYLGKRDAWKEKEFTNDLYAVLVKATENGEWDLMHHIEILDDPMQVPIRNTFYNILKVAHFYYYKNSLSSQLPQLSSKGSNALSICNWLIAYIQQDERQETIKKDILSIQKYLSVNYNNVFYRTAEQKTLDLESIFYAFYDENYRSLRIGLNSLLRIFFSQPQQEFFEIKALDKPKDWILNYQCADYFDLIQVFASDYQAYYFDKYENQETGSKPIDKFRNLVKAISKENSKFLIWFYEAIENTNEFLKEGNKSIPDKWSDSILYSPNGEYMLSFSRFAIKFSLLKQSEKSLLTNYINLTK